MDDRPDEELRNALKRAEKELIERLEEPCELVSAQPGEESTGELLQLEDSLLAAARAAERVIELRRRCRDNGLTEKSEQVLRDEELPIAPANETVREFRTSEGADWRVWAVKPDAHRSGTVTPRFLPEYREGWLAFEALDGSARRRLPGIPAGWAQSGETRLRELFELACPAKPKRRAGDRDEAGPPSAGDPIGGGEVQLRQAGSPRQAEGAAG